jgi:four helix bundle protein
VAVNHFRVRSHRELLAWQRAHLVATAVHQYAARCWRPNLAVPIDQLRRSALSVQLNIAEKFAVGRSPRCREHLRIAYGSAVETTELLEFLVELTADDLPLLQTLTQRSRETQALTLRLWQRSKP